MLVAMVEVTASFDHNTGATAKNYQQNQPLIFIDQIFAIDSQQTHKL